MMDIKTVFEEAKEALRSSMRLADEKLMKAMETVEEQRKEERAKWEAELSQSQEKLLKAGKRSRQLSEEIARLKEGKKALREELRTRAKQHADAELQIQEERNHWEEERREVRRKMEERECADRTLRGQLEEADNLLSRAEQGIRELETQRKEERAKLEAELAQSEMRLLKADTSNRDFNKEITRLKEGKKTLQENLRAQAKGKANAKLLMQEERAHWEEERRAGSRKMEEQLQRILKLETELREERSQWCEKEAQRALRDSETHKAREEERKGWEDERRRWDQERVQITQERDDLAKKSLSKQATFSHMEGTASPAEAETSVLSHPALSIPNTNSTSKASTDSASLAPEVHTDSPSKASTDSASLVSEVVRLDKRNRSPVMNKSSRVVPQVKVPTTKMTTDTGPAQEPVPAQEGLKVEQTGLSQVTAETKMTYAQALALPPRPKQTVKPTVVIISSSRGVKSPGEPSLARKVASPLAEGTKRNEAQMQASRYADRQLFVGKIPRQVHKAQLKEFFEKYGAVQSLVIKKGATKRNYGFVTFHEAKSMEKILGIRPIRFGVDDCLHIERIKQHRQVQKKP